ncbi:MAG: TetR/AcrR family transcriptional regulator [Pseudomonadota bacterium]
MPETAKSVRTQEERREMSEKQMLKAAIRLFAKQGYLKTTLTEVGREAGYTAGLVSHKFGSKEGLLQAVVEHISERFLNDQLGSAIQEESANQSLNNYIEIYLTEVSLRAGPMRALYAIMGEAVGSVPEIRQSIADLNSGARGRLKDIIQRGINQEEFNPDIDVEAAAALIIGALRGLVMQHLVDPKNVNLKSMRAGVQATVTASLSRSS